MLERVRGIEPRSSAWKAASLPLRYTRELAEQGGSEPHPLAGTIGLANRAGRLAGSMLHW